MRVLRENVGISRVLLRMLAHQCSGSDPATTRSKPPLTGVSDTLHFQVHNSVLTLGSGYGDCRSLGKQDKRLRCVAVLKTVFRRRCSVRETMKTDNFDPNDCSNTGGDANMGRRFPAVESLPVAARLRQFLGGD